jgi:hypothetical protein
LQASPILLDLPTSGRQITGAAPSSTHRGAHSTTNLTADAISTEKRVCVDQRDQLLDGRQFGNWNKRVRETTGLVIKFRHPITSIAIASIVSGAEPLIVTIRDTVARKSIASIVAAASSCMCGST